MVAVAYFGKGASRLLPLKRGSTLIVDMSRRAVGSGQTMPLTLTLRLQSGGPDNEYTGLTTDAGGYFTVTTGLPDGSYNWRLKGQLSLASSGTLGLSSSTANVEMGMMRAGDCTNDNVVSGQDFSVLKNTFGKSSGQPGYDDRADFNRDGVVGSADFSLLKGSFGQGGASLTCP